MRRPSPGSLRSPTMRLATIPSATGAAAKAAYASDSDEDVMPVRGLTPPAEGDDRGQHMKTPDALRLGHMVMEDI